MQNTQTVRFRYRYLRSGPADDLHSSGNDHPDPATTTVVTTTVQTLPPPTTTVLTVTQPAAVTPAWIWGIIGIGAGPDHRGCCPDRPDTPNGLVSLRFEA